MQGFAYDLTTFSMVQHERPEGLLKVNVLQATGEKRGGGGGARADRCWAATPPTHTPMPHPPRRPATPHPTPHAGVPRTDWFGLSDPYVKLWVTPRVSLSTATKNRQAPMRAPPPRPHAP